MTAYGATVELYDTSNTLISSTATAAGGSYSFTKIPVGDYNVKVVEDTVSSTRTGSNGSELGIMTYHTDGTVAGEKTNDVGGQTLQPITLAATNLSNVNFGFNFDAVTNTNDAGQGSLRQFLLNANQLGDDSTLSQAGQTVGKESAIMVLSTSDPNYNTTGKYWSIATLSALPNITAPMVLDSSTQPGFVSAPALELNGSKAGAGVNGLTLAAGSNGSRISNMAINRFKGAGIYVNGSNSHTLQANRIGTDPAGTTAHANSGAGILLNASSNNLIGDSAGTAGNLIANNGGAGIAVTGATSVANTIIGNSIHSNDKLGIDLDNDGVTSNDLLDADTGPNQLLNYPEVQAASFSTNGSRIITYDFNLDVPGNANGYRLEFFKNTDRDASGNGEGQVWLGSKDFPHPGGGPLNFKGSFNANQAVSPSEFVSVTVTEKTAAAAFGSTSEFSGSVSNSSNLVCTDLITNPTAALPDIVIDENATGVTYLKATDKSGNPVTYVITGGADAPMFTVGKVTNGTVDCAQIQFVKSIVVKDALADTRALIPGFVDPGNFEIPLDKDKNNVYDIEVTATDSTGKKYVRTLSMRVMDVNEAPIITSSATATLEENGTTQALDINTLDQDAVDQEGSGLSYALSGGADQDKFSLNTSNGVLSFKTVPDYDAPTDANKDNVYEASVTVTDHGGLTASKTFSITITNRTADDGVKLQARAFLQGAYNSTNKLMSSTLNTLGLLPDNQPYTAAPFNYAGTETLSTTVKETGGNDAPVDWMLVELRSSLTTTVASRAIIVQRDGDLVDAQTGSTTLHFPRITAGNYYVSVRHRNHLGIITASPISLDNTEKLVDFTLSTTAVQGNQARYLSGTLALMWSGDINGSTTLTANGPSNDITSLLSSILTNKDNPQAYTNYILYGYLNTDTNMDGKTLFTGPGNDANSLLGNIIMHPLNTNFAANYIVRGGLQ
jgi:hypothetical protein